MIHILALHPHPIDDFQYWSWSLAIFSLTGFVLIARRIWWAWFINTCVQVVWIIYWMIHEQPGPIITNVVFIMVFLQSAWKWSKEYHFEDKDLPKGERRLGRLTEGRRRNRAARQHVETDTSE